MSIESLQEKASYLSEEDRELLYQAYLFASEAHREQIRKSGEPYILHPLAVTEILAELKMDATTLVAALLHDVVEDTGTTLEEIATHFGETAAQLVDGVTKLKKLKYKSTEEHQAENHRKMFLAMSEDIRVIMIKLADRLHNMRTLKYLPEAKRRRIANETLEIFAPIAHRLGISRVKWELEDTALRYLNPYQYYRIVNLMKQKRAEREQYVDEVIQQLRERYAQMGVEAEVSGRPKHIYSIYRKMVKKNKQFNEIYDLLAIRVLVNNVRDCYAALGTIHTIWKPMPGRFKDYIAMPKVNMYQSLHTTVLGLRGEPIEVQIRTHDMHRTAEYGIAAHWAYKEGAEVDSGTFEEKLQWFREIMESQQETKDAQEFVENLKMDWFSDAVFVFTPKGDVIELPAGSITLDFAFRIHTEIGNQCIGAKVNGKLVPLDYKLKTGDIIEILTSKHSYGPSRDWLKIVKSSHARTKIRNWFKKQQREESVAKGKEMIEALLKKHDFHPSEVITSERLKVVADKFNFSDETDMYAAVGYGGITTAQVVTRLTQGLTPEEKKETITLPDMKAMPERRRVSHGVQVIGVSNLLVRLSRCCNPVPGDDIAGFVTQGRGVSVHRADCPNLSSVEEERLIPVQWEGGGVSKAYNVDIEVSGLDRTGLLNDLLQAISEKNVTLTAVSGKADRRGMARVHLSITIENIKHLQAVVERIKKVKDIYSVRRLMQ
ncbi:bifunctional (p)ppGpp synthetase/guanosine-3',5'-bis(diphosphate) 3'-pyrophosphohydrolase [Mechercharimyces sp. CAU 1602]|uniref:RelA/SpoT family protein n=1 Tax=Mechercharimyces sp. CAU 1602 TaxID=2973933 RepID=UPI0021612503|nr:bifunctional (p)ppGpp synthetase/guanosine-3',5'-bis(diphosphate) 3'-pyrophosphohydrolase [Mechercharimyces sp. CAU 1602]MCS1350245.1 bifunctional (p)ppGpp synthetase/guanosine-3',5'-bis(diphosphate) 3'-pyrophosphohydrolase [Mechercharimyces sp. CAU 1602]